MDIHKTPASEKNYSKGRRGHTLSYLVIHTMQGTFKGTKAWFANPEAGTSAHYGISFDGEVCQYVPDEDTAWHAGNALYNRKSVGIELEGFMEKKFFPEKMMDALVSLCAELVKRHKLTVDRHHIIGHCEVPNPKDPTQLGGAQHHKDPGPAFPWDTFMEKLHKACETSTRTPSV